MPNSATQTLAANLQRLMTAEDNLSARKLAKRSGVSQRAISYLLLHSDREDRHPSTLTVELLAKAFRLEAWQLLMPDLPVSGTIDPELVLRHSRGTGLDPALFEASIETAISAFHGAKRIPTGKQVVAAANYVYTMVITGRKVKEAERAVTQLLVTAGNAEPNFKSVKSVS